jgi:hypothetical protein
MAAAPGKCKQSVGFTNGDTDRKHGPSRTQTVSFEVRVINTDLLRINIMIRSQHHVPTPPAGTGSQNLSFVP